MKTTAQYCAVCPLYKFHSEVPRKDQLRLLPKAHKFCKKLKVEQECLHTTAPSSSGQGHRLFTP